MQVTFIMLSRNIFHTTPFVRREKSKKCATFDKNWYAVSFRENDLDYELPDYFVQCININGFVER